MTKLRVFPLALALGATWGLAILFLGWVSASGWGARLVEVFSNLYLGYTSTFLGAVIGGLWAFGDAFLGGLVFAFFYNAFAGARAESTHIYTHAEQPAH